MQLKTYLSRFPFLAGLAASLYRKAVIKVSIDADKDYRINANGLSYYSSSPFSWYDDISKQLHERYYTCKSGDNAIIVGVEDGLELVHFCNTCRPGLVIAVEPSPDCIRRLWKLKLKNSLSNLCIIHAAAGNRSDSSVGMAKISSDRPDLSMRLSEIGESDSDCTTVAMTTLEDIINREGVRRVDYLKINVEGAELMVLEGLGQYAREVRHLCVSCHDFISPSLRTYDAVTDWLLKKDYSIHSASFVLERPWENYYIFAERTKVA